MDESSTTERPGTDAGDPRYTTVSNPRRVRV